MTCTHPEPQWCEHHRNHANSCCTKCGHHLTPHVGCILR